ncbi:MAG: spore germination protein, partial [Bacilli bacterium]|nr:spore germination protein [Bacilli bacterium]
MSIWSGISRLLTVNDTVMDEDFSLGYRDTNEEQAQGADAQDNESTDKPRIHGSDPLPSSLEDIKQGLERLFHLPANKDIVFREIWTNTEQTAKGLVVFVDGMADRMVINSHILEPLMYFASTSKVGSASTDIDTVHQRLVPGNQVAKVTCWKDLTAGILAGASAVLIDGNAAGLIVETRGWEHRPVSVAQTEPVIQGPHNAFTESLRSNTGLVRAQIRSKDLVTEMMSLGQISRTDVALMYVHGVANPKLVAEARRRITSIKIDFIQDTGVLEQLIEDGPFSLIPKLLGTERPDRVSAKLMEGHIAIFLGNSPFVLIAPVLFWLLIQTPEDFFLKFPFGGITRMIRVFSMLLAMLLPALYIAVTNFHPEMIPSDFLFTIAASRERVPFPLVVEVLLMEFSIELIREAGIRIPSVIGPTIGIVGALILGQAAVSAGIVSPILVITVAVTALASFTLPNYNFGFAVRAVRFLFIVAA